MSYEEEIEGLDALRDGTRNPIPMRPCVCGRPMPAHSRISLCAACSWAAEDRASHPERETR